jgi:hypothetical protein
MAWVIESHLGTGDDISKMYSIEPYASGDDGNLTFKTYYEVPSSLGEDDYPYEYLIGKENVIPND